MIIELIRHGETSYSIDHRYLGKKDEPLCAQGIEELAEQKCEKPTLSVYVTCLQRTAQTAGILYPGLEQIVVPGLEEMDFGVFEGRSAAQMEQDSQYRAWVESGCLDRCPGGETKEEFSRRVVGAFLSMIEEAEKRGEEHVILVCHGGTIMVVMEQFAVPHKEYFRWGVPCGCGYQVQMDRGTRRMHVLKTLNCRKGSGHLHVME